MSKYLEYEKFKKELNEKLSASEPENVLKNIINNPYRYITNLRISKIDDKIIQNITQSREINFGYFLEDIITKYLEIIGYTNLCKIFSYKKEKLVYDQLFKDDNDTIYMIEQKIRDDHDSTKKVGQINNFKRKIENLIEVKTSQKIIAIMWFLDDTFRKNINYYKNCIENLKKEFNIEIHLFYGRDFFAFINSVGVWDELNNYIDKYRKDDAIKLKMYDFDNDISLLNVLINLENKYWNKLVSNKYPYNEIRKLFFKNNKNLRLAKEKRGENANK